MLTAVREQRVPKNGNVGGRHGVWRSERRRDYGVVDLEASKRDKDTMGRGVV